MKAPKRVFKAGLTKEDIDQATVQFSKAAKQAYSAAGLMSKLKKSFENLQAAGSKIAETSKKLY